MGNRIKPEKILGIKIGGEIDEVYRNKYFTFRFKSRSRELVEDLENLRPRVQKVENGDYKYFREPTRNSRVHLIYLNEESLKGLYNDSENNLPYEIIESFTGNLIYRQSIIDKKEDIFNKLEEVAEKEGLRK